MNRPIDISEVLRSKFIGKKIRHSATGITIADGQVDAHSPCPPANVCYLQRNLGFGELTFEGLKVTYGETTEINLPKQKVRRRWILENHTDVPDKKNLTLTLSFTESIVAAMSTSITEGKNVTFSGSASFDFKVFGKYSFGYTEVITLSVRNDVSRTETRTNVKTETYDFGYEIPPRTAAIVDLTKELVPYGTPFKVQGVVDGFFFIVTTNLTAGNYVTVQPIDKAWGRISDYLSENERTIEFDGELEEVAGEVTRRSVKFEPLSGDPSNSIKQDNILDCDLYYPALTSTVTNATISLWELTGGPSGYFDVSFMVEVIGCLHSACAGFNATLVFETDNGYVSERRSFDGWSYGESGTTVFTIRKNGMGSGLLVDIVEIDLPEIICGDGEPFGKLKGA